MNGNAIDSGATGHWVWRADADHPGPTHRPRWRIACTFHPRSCTKTTRVLKMQTQPARRNEFHQRQICTSGGSSTEKPPLVLPDANRVEEWGRTGQNHCRQWRYGPGWGQTHAPWTNDNLGPVTLTQCPEYPDTRDTVYPDSPAKGEEKWERGKPNKGPSWKGLPASHFHLQTHPHPNWLGPGNQRWAAHATATPGLSSTVETKSAS